MEVSVLGFRLRFERHWMLIQLTTRKFFLDECVLMLDLCRIWWAIHEYDTKLSAKRLIPFQRPFESHPRRPQAHQSRPSGNITFRFWSCWAILDPQMERQSRLEWSSTNRIPIKRLINPDSSWVFAVKRKQNRKSYDKEIEICYNQL